MPAFSKAMRAKGSSGVPASGTSKKASRSMPSVAMPQTAGFSSTLVAP